MRARNLKPSFFSNEKLAECSFEARLFFAGLWCVADKNGVIENRPKRLRGEIFPHDFNIQVEALIAQLEKVGLVITYESAGIPLIFISGWEQHANPHWKEPSRFPLPEKAQTSPDKSGQVQTSPGHIVNENQPCALNPSSLFLNPESGILNPEASPPSKAEEEKPKIKKTPDAADCAAQWQFVASAARSTTKHDDPREVRKSFEEWHRQGVAFEVMLAAILDPKRVRTESFWEFEKREIKPRLQSRSPPPVNRLAEKQRQIRERMEREGRT